MRLRSTPFLLYLLLWGIACTKQPPTATTTISVLTPESITVQAYVGSTTRTEVDFRLDGQPLNTSEAEFSFMRESGRPSFEVAHAPLSNELVIVYSPEAGSESRALLILKYRGHEYSVPLRGEALVVPFCGFSGDECRSNQFNPRSEQCESVLLSNSSCESADCTNPGVCASGGCLHHEIDLPAPKCSQAAPLTQVAPTWSYSPPPGNTVIGPLVLDEDGNSYFFELGRGEFVSLDSVGALRWREPLSGILSADESQIDLRTTALHVFVLDRSANHLWVFQRADGTLLWERTFQRSIRMLPAGDELWTLVDVHNPLGAELDIFDAATGGLRDVPELPFVPNWIQFAYYDLFADDEGTVYLVGTSDIANPDTTGIAAMAPVGREPLWMTAIVMARAGLTFPAARMGSLLLFQNGIALDLKTREFSPNETWQQELALLNSRSFVLNADGTGYRETSTRTSCSIATLSHVNVKMGAPDWECVLGSATMSGRVLGRTPPGSAVVMSLDIQGLNSLTPRLRIIDGSGAERFDGALSVGRIETSGPTLLSIRGQRLLIREANEHSAADLIVAYDIPELLTK
jgi:hypothetical protein